MEDRLQRLVSAGIQLVPAEAPGYVIFERDGFISLVAKHGDGFGSVGSPALVTENGLAMLVWRGESAFFVAKGHEQPATPEQVDALRRFAGDLETALA